MITKQSIKKIPTTLLMLLIRTVILTLTQSLFLRKLKVITSNLGLLLLNSLLLLNTIPVVQLNN